MKRGPRLELAIVALVLTLSLGFRLAGLDVFLVHDEMRWACRSVGFRAGMIRGDWAETYRVGHPGVVTMWLGALSIPNREAQAEAACEAFDDYRHFDDDNLPATTKGELSEVGAMVFRGRVGVALFTWLSIIALYFLTRTLLGARIAVLSLALIALDPFYLALSRFLHTDAIHASLMTLSVLSLLVSVRRGTSDRPGLALLLASGAASGLAMVQKSPAVFLAPFTVLLLTAFFLRRGAGKASTARTLRALALWGVAAAVIYVAAWPAMWSDPLGTIGKVLNTATRYAKEGHTPGNYFLGQAVHDPGWLFYPVVALFRLSPLTLVGLVGVVARFTAKGFRGVRSFALTALLAYSVLFGGFMSLGDKMFDRYLLPALPALIITAAAGLLWLATGLEKWVRRKRGLGRYLSRRRTYVGVVALALVVQAVMLLVHYPYYLTYYDPFLGGATQARRALLVGWGEGY
ncbi:MAG: glycosyltransferase family 39 protein, partial [Anaerolineae bacterium]